MNKIKLMYSIAKTMKEKDHFNGSLQVECIKDQAKLFQMTNEFSKDLSSGMAKARIKTEMDYAGKSIRAATNLAIRRTFTDMKAFLKEGTLVSTRGAAGTWG